LNLRPSGYEATDEGLQTASDFTNPSESLDSQGGVSEPQMQTESSPHKNFGQPVVSDLPAPVEEVPLEQPGQNALLTPAQAAARFNIPEYLLREACLEGRLEHLRVVNMLWLSPSVVAAFVESLRAKPRRRD